MQGDMKRTGEDVHHLTRAEIELGEHHPAVAQLLTMSLCLRLRLICREADQSVLRGTERCQKESDEDDTLNLGKMGSPAPTAAVTIQELAEKQEVIDPGYLRLCNVDAKFVNWSTWGSSSRNCN